MELNSIIQFSFWLFREITFLYQIQAARLPEKVLIMSFATINVSLFLSSSLLNFLLHHLFFSKSLPLYKYFWKET